MPAPSQRRQQNRNHHSDANRFGMIPKLLIRVAAGILMTDSFSFHLGPALFVRTRDAKQELGKIVPFPQSRRNAVTN